MLKVYSFIVFVSILFTSSYSQLVGDSCTGDNGQPGRCSRINNCPAALAGLRKGVRPRLCGFMGSEPIACCVSGTSQTTPRPTTRAPTTQRCRPIDGVTAQKTGQKAWDKCIDIAESIYPCQLDGDSLSASYSRADRCSHNSVSLIVGGTPADPNEFQHMALLGFGDAPDISWQCGGSLISERWVMTAGHCLQSRQSGPVKHIRLGSPNINDPVVPDLLYTVARSVPHPEYLGSSVYNDIALLQTDRTVVFSNRVIPACIHTGNRADDTKFLASGWGDTESGGTRSSQLLKVTLEKFSQSDCSAKNPSNRKLRDGIREATQLCAGHNTEIKDTCQGDSGGPLQVYNFDVKCAYTIMGVTSFGRSCGTPGQPAVYTRVSAFVPWIESVVWP